MKKKFSPFAIIAIIAIVANIVLAFIMKDIKLFITISLCLLGATFIFSIITLITAKRMNHSGKGIAILLLILSIFGLLLSFILNTAFKILVDPKITEQEKLCDKAKECVDKKGISTCNFDGIKDIKMKCKTSLLNDSQMK